MKLTRDILGPIARDYVGTKFENFFSQAKLTIAAKNNSAGIDPVTLSNYLDTPRTTDEICSDFGWDNVAATRFLRGLYSLNLVNCTSGHRYVSSGRFASGETALSRGLFNWFDKPNNEFRRFSSLSEINQTSIGLDFISDMLSAKVVLDQEDILFLWYYRYVVSRYLTDNVLLNSLISGKSQVQSALGVSGDQIFDLYCSEPLLLETYSKGFASINANSNEMVAKRLPPMTGSVLDVGGGVGGLAQAILRNHSLTQFVDIYELEAARNMIISCEPEMKRMFSNRINWRYGNFFIENPNGGLVNLEENSKYNNIILSWVLHDWDDEACVDILKKLHVNLESDGRIIIVEGIRNKNDDKSFLNVVDYVIFLMANGRERTLDEYRHIFEKSNFDIADIIYSDSGRDAMILKSRC